MYTKRHIAHKNDEMSIC